MERKLLIINSDKRVCSTYINILALDIEITEKLITKFCNKEYHSFQWCKKKSSKTIRIKIIVSIKVPFGDHGILEK